MSAVVNPLHVLLLANSAQLPPLIGLDINYLLGATFEFDVDKYCKFLKATEI